MHQFSHRVVRDLAWVISSPPLVSGNYHNTHWWSHKDCLNEFNDCLSTLEKLDKNPAALVEHLAKLKSKRLGLRFESFVAYWLHISPNFELLTQNLQIIERVDNISHTYGEIDFIIRNIHTNKIIHLEVAVKFYLGCKPYEDAFRWYGTNTLDQLGKKVSHLQNHQTQISDKFDQYLVERDFIIDEKHCFLKGRLFYPLGENTPPQGVTDTHLRGRWIQDTAIQSHYNFVSLINKPDWLAEFSHKELQERCLDKEFTKSEKAQCYIGITQQTTGKYKEVERVFYLPEDFTFPKN